MAIKWKQIKYSVLFFSLFQHFLPLADFTLKHQTNLIKLTLLQRCVANWLSQQMLMNTVMNDKKTSHCRGIVWVKFKFLYHLLSRSIFREIQDYGPSPNSHCWASPLAAELGKELAKGPPTDHFKSFHMEVLHRFIQQGVFNQLILLRTATGTLQLPDDRSCPAGFQD